ncbi:protein of unknown function DUF4332-containing protein [Synechococcus sp. A15-127]|uniref:DUF4332 domain-containing protein n=1 Tax=Synechococcus sp. A15-127 TaxID=1050624 RepID=UPI0016460E9C|nr:DUF4332 domain-containing protein [Synechococcus sp. A15-127]QNI94186.1 protein of unknown function DUF4332-containing protein [Synechococcus sp. A15-127]
MSGGDQSHPREWNDLPQSFRQERTDLEKAGIRSWEALRDLDDLQLSRLVRNGRSSPRNLNRLRGIATLVCEMDLAPQDAALLMHAGIASRRALADCTPEQLVRQTGRLQRSLGIARPGSVDLPMAKAWIQQARQLRN